MRGDAFAYWRADWGWLWSSSRARSGILGPIDWEDMLHLHDPFEPNEMEYRPG